MLSNFQSDKYNESWGNLEQMHQYQALLIIDMQLVAFDGEITPPIQDGTRILKNVASLVTACRTAGLHMVFIQTRAASGQPYAEDVHGWEIHPTITPEIGDTIVFKVNSDGFEDTELESILNELGVRNLITCGIWSEYCLARTSTTAIGLGFNVLVAGDAHGTVSESQMAARAIVDSQNELLAKRNARVSTTKEICEML